MSSLNEKHKEKILKWIFTQVPVIVLKNDFMDAEQIVYIESEQKVYWENWSPRENLTYSRRQLGIDETWEYVLKYANGWIVKAIACIEKAA